MEGNDFRDNFKKHFGSCQKLQANEIENTNAKPFYLSVIFKEEKRRTQYNVSREGQFSLPWLF